MVHCRRVVYPRGYIEFEAAQSKKSSKNAAEIPITVRVQRKTLFDWQDVNLIIRSIRTIKVPPYIYPREDYYDNLWAIHFQVDENNIESVRKLWNALLKSKIRFGTEQGPGWRRVMHPEPGIGVIGFINTLKNLGFEVRSCIY